jgi:hypothetical protein
VTETCLLTADETAVNTAVLDPAAIVTEAGTVRAELLLFSDTVTALIADADRLTEQALLCAPVKD